jgi:hypothetical protein
MLVKHLHYFYSCPLQQCLVIQPQSDPASKAVVVVAVEVVEEEAAN